jgi:flagellar motility protein MotE (MotC chaperone)
MITEIKESKSPKRRDELLNDASRIQENLKKLLDGFKEDLKCLGELREQFCQIRDNTN